MTPKGTRTNRIAALLGALAAAAALAAPASAGAAPALEVDTMHFPKRNAVPNDTYAIYIITVENSGTEETTAPATVEFSVPPGLKVAKAGDEVNASFGLPTWDCAIAPNELSVSCDGPELFGSPLGIPAGDKACETNPELMVPCRLFIHAKADAGAAPGTLHPTTTVCGGGDTVCPVVADTADDDPVNIIPFQFYLPEFDGETLNEADELANEAGSHPHLALTNFVVGSYTTGGNPIDFNGFQPINNPIEELKDATVELPPGLIGNPQAYPKCAQVQLGSNSCPNESQIGVVRIETTEGWYSGFSLALPVYNMEVPFGLPALFGFNLFGSITMIYGELRSGDDYGVNLVTKNIPQTLPLEEIAFEFWGVPADPSHDLDRGFSAGGGGACVGTTSSSCTNPSSAPLKSFVSLPTSCVGAVETGITAMSWLDSEANSAFLSHMPGEPGNTIGVAGCNAVDFSPTLEARPTTNVADAPSGLDFNVHIPQSENCSPGPPVSCETASGHLRQATVTLPKGLVINPSAGNGLDSCSAAEVGLTTPVGTTPIQTTPEPAECPNASKIGTVRVDTPLLDNPAFGSVFVADPYNNPFESLLALYVTVDDPQTSTVVKLAGEVTADPSTGRLTTTFEESPQLPFEDFELHLFGGAGGALRTPAVCGNHTATSTLVPWTAPDGATKSPSDTWAVTQGPNGTSCSGSDASKPHAPELDAGTVSPIAGAYSPLVVNLRREDGSQNFSQVTLTPPPGLVGKLAGVPYCPDSGLAAAAGKSGEDEKANPSCSVASKVGVVDVAAGAGPAPYHAHGTAYLTGPYKGAPISLAVITPATAGAFDLGTVVTRVALHINPASVQITAVADQLPEILEGIPLDIRSVQIALDRPEFSLTPTSCDPMAFTGQLVSTLGQAAALQNRFQLGECDALGLAPKMSLRLTGATKRRGHPSLTATLEPGTGVANLKSVSVALPPTQLLDQRHIGTVCTRVQFAADQCPAASVYGTATVQTPLLDYPLTGNVYLRASNNKLPDLVPDLRGPAHQPIKLEAAGRTDTVKKALRNTFEGIPDAPFTKLVLTLPGGRKGLIQNSANICAKPLRATVKYEAHNGYTLAEKPKLKTACKKRKRKSRGKNRRSNRRAAVRHLRAVR